jgi:Arc/MetJ-type ribon-helix-helix transcriptional regulator
MSSNLNIPRELQVLISIRIPPTMAEALKQAAAKRFSSVSDVAREAVANDLRRQGLLAE